MIKIDKNVPIPLRAKKYPWHELNIGDSFAVPITLKSAIYQSNKLYKPKKFICRQEDNHWRVWRIN